LFGNRELVIPIECTADAVVLHPTRQRFPAAVLLQGEGGGNSLSQTVRQMIERRQAGVRPGEPPFRPSIRFLVRPAGLRSYYLAWPALEGLHLPMTRENLDAEDEVGPKHFLR
jgi:hypothetical protein